MSTIGSEQAHDSAKAHVTGKPAMLTISNLRRGNCTSLWARLA
jgi:hypothetical protein